MRLSDGNPCATHDHYMHLAYLLYTYKDLYRHYEYILKPYLCGLFIPQPIESN